ncbi:MAG: ImmA/IrrE family metallo-endopeptidase [Blastocatellia bacterium]|nr:ImmA/IrrE family metallo-endopeptidase [Blastocatellia bacterium]
MRGSKSSIVEPDMLPPVRAKFREIERKAIGVRCFAGVGQGARLDPYALAALLNLRIVSLTDLDQLPEETRQHLAHSDEWSAGTTGMLPDGSRVIVINEKQSAGRRAATLMEEICHTLLGHDPSSISGNGAGGRSYDVSIEEEAYAVGAAALLPYRALSQCLSEGDPIDQIAKRYGVTKALVEYRMRVLGLWE